MDRPAVTPCVFYRDPIGAMKWLEAAFGFETAVLITDPQGAVAYSEMTFLGSQISIGGEWTGPQLGGAAMKSPASLGGVGTQFLRIAIPDGLDAHCAKARAAGARITEEPSDQFYGDRTYRAADLEGHVWNFSQAIGVVSDDEMHAAAGLTVRTNLEGA